MAAEEKQLNCTNVLIGFSSRTTGDVFSFQSSIAHSDIIYSKQQRYNAQNQHNLHSKKLPETYVQKTSG